MKVKGVELVRKLVLSRYYTDSEHIPRNPRIHECKCPGSRSFVSLFIIYYAHSFNISLSLMFFFFLGQLARYAQGILVYVFMYVEVWTLHYDSIARNVCTKDMYECIFERSEHLRKT